MKKCIKSLSSLLLIVCALVSQAQDIPVGTWRSHFSYREVSNLAASTDQIYVSCQNVLYSINQNQEISVIGKSQGLSDVGISAMTYSTSNDLLLIGYQSGLIDIIGGGISTISDIKDSSLPGEKSIFNLKSSGQFAYAGTSFGIIVIDLERNEIIDNYRSIGEGGADVTVLEILIEDQTIYAKTDSHFQYGSLNDNLLDFSNWTRIDDDLSSDLTSFDGDIYAIRSDQSIVKYSEGDMQWELVSNAPENLVDLEVHDNGLYASSEKSLYKLESGNLSLVKSYTNFAAAKMISFNAEIWIGGDNGLLDPDNDVILPSGPYSDNISNVRMTNNELYAFFGPSPESYFGNIDSLGFNQWDGQSWAYQVVDGFYNITDIAHFKEKTYLASTGLGLYDLVNNQLVSDIHSQAIIPEIEVYDNLTGIIYDSDTSLFTISENLEYSYYTPTEIGSHFPVGITRSQADVLWITRGSNERGIALNYLPDGNQRILSATDGLPSTNINSVAIDQSDAAWIGTNDGPGFLSDASFAFQNEPVQLPIFENQLLFNDFNIESILIDGGNRVWMSTKEGLFVFNNNLSRLDHHFTTENSPLPSHSIKKMEYNPKNGEVIILTDKGLVSYRSSSSRASSKHQNVKIFPNPVRPGYDGLVAISGLANDVIIKITNADGQLMNEIKSNGGTASWDMRTYYGQHVPSGVYVLFSSTGDGSETYIGKLAIVQ